MPERAIVDIAKQWGNLATAGSENWFGGSSTARQARRGQEYDLQWNQIGMLNPTQLGWEGGAHGAFPSHQALKQFGNQPWAMSDLGFTFLMPGSLIAPEVQLMAERRVAERNQRLLKGAQHRGRGLYGQIPGLFEQARGAYGSAQNVLAQGLETQSVYRPGGNAESLAPYYQGIARTAMGQGDLFAQQASYLPRQAQWETGMAISRMTEAPDLMFRYDEQVRKSAERQARNTRNLGFIMAGAQLMASAGLTAGMMNPQQPQQPIA